MILGKYVKGFILIVWEVLININSHLNTAIIYSFTGRFQQVKNVLDKRWLALYMAIYVYGIWDSYRLTIDINKFSLLADREKSTFIPFRMNSIELNYLDKKIPWLAAAWSALMPGSGHLYINRIPTGFLILIWWIVFNYFSNFLPALHHTAVGEFAEAIAVTDPQWLLFLPSIYVFSIYDSYMNTVEYNKLFEMEQARFLSDKYQQPDFEMPF